MMGADVLPRKLFSAERDFFQTYVIFIYVKEILKTMRIILKRYYGDRTITKSELEVWMDGETEPRMACDAREPKFFNYALSFPGASSYCLPAGTFKNIQTMFKIIPAYPSFKEYGEIRLSLERTGQRIDQFDLLIGATAIHHQMTVVTSNVKHFERIPDMIYEDWK